MDFRKVALVDREADQSAGVNEQQWLFRRDVGERRRERNGELLSRHYNPNSVAERIAKRAELHLADVRHEVAKRPVSRDDHALNSLLADQGMRRIEPCKARDEGSYLCPVLATGKACADRRIDIAPVKRRRG